MMGKIRTTGSLSDADYFERRAEAEIAAAQAASHAAVVRAHYELAGHYLDLVHNPEANCDPETSGPERASPAAMQGFTVIATRTDPRSQA